jgi:hypothetical protein
MQWQRSLSVSAITLALFAAFAVTPTSYVKADDDQDESIVGTWIGAATFSTPPGAPAFIEAELASLYPGGIVTGTDAIDHSSQNPFLPPALAVTRSDYFGTWMHMDDSDQIAVTFKRLLFAGPLTPFAIYQQSFVGQNIGLATIQAVLTFQHSKSGDILSGPFTYQQTRLPPPLGDGKQVFAGSGTVSFTRVAIEPLATP